MEIRDEEGKKQETDLESQDFESCRCDSLPPTWFWKKSQHDRAIYGS